MLPSTSVSIETEIDPCEMGSYDCTVLFYVKTMTQVPHESICDRLCILSVFCIQCMHLIVQSSQKLCAVTGKSSMTYADVAEYTISTSSNKKIHRYAKAFR